MTSFKTDGKVLLISFIGILIAVAMIASIADNVVETTTILNVSNLTITMPSAVNTSQDLQGRTLSAGLSIANATNGTNIMDTGGASFQTGVGDDGLQSVQIILNDTAAPYVSTPYKVSYTAEPDGYVPTSGGRSITRLITLFSALAILIFSVVMLWQGSISNFIKSKSAR